MVESVIVIIIIVVLDSHMDFPFGVRSPGTVVIAVMVDFIAIATSIELKFYSIHEFHLILFTTIVVVNLGVGNALTLVVLLDVEFSCLRELIGRNDMVVCVTNGGHHQAHECCHEKFNCSHNCSFFVILIFCFLR